MRTEMAKRKRKEEPIEGESCAALAARIQKLEKAFKHMTGVSAEEYEASEADNPVVEEKRYDRSVVKIHKSGAVEHLRVCGWCGTEVADLASHKAVCPSRPIY